MSTSKQKPKVAYMYDSDVGTFSYEQGHLMKPHRIRMAHSLVMHYGLHKHMEIYRAKPATQLEMTQFHTDEYIDFIRTVTPETVNNYVREKLRYNLGDDCPVFDGLFDFCGISAGGTMEGAARLNRKKCDIAVNWAGGLHHAKKGEASGFCYVNDIVLGILELLRFHQRVVYIDIDVHHGDGVEEAFYTTDRVMTVSFHKFGEFFPGTGALQDIGVGKGKKYAINVPLRDGIDDDSYKNLFEKVISNVVECYRPGAIVLQCGADSLAGDRLGCFNLSMKGHANCVAFVKSLGLPLLVLGGGGYTVSNTCRAWAYETGIVVGQEMDPVLPYNEYYEYFGPEYELNVRASNATNANTDVYLNKISSEIIKNLRSLPFAPSVQMTDVPRDIEGMDDEADAEMKDLDEDEHKDERVTQHRWEKRTQENDGYMSDSDDEETTASYIGNGKRNANGRRSLGGSVNGNRRRNITDYPNPNAAVDTVPTVSIMDVANDNAISNEQGNAVVAARLTPEPEAAPADKMEIDPPEVQPEAPVAPAIAVSAPAEETVTPMAAALSPTSKRSPSVAPNDEPVETSKPDGDGEEKTL